MNTADTVLALGVIFMFGVAADLLGRSTFLPRVTTLLVCGILVGPVGFDFLPASITGAVDIITTMTLLMVGFLLGGRLNKNTFEVSGRALFGVSVVAALGAVVTVTAGLLLIGLDSGLALLFGCIASATAPAATLDTIVEGEYTGPFADLLAAIVALDDAWALLLFSLGLTVALATNGHAGDSLLLWTMAWDILGGVGVGVVVGVPGAYLTGRIRPGEPTLVEALGLVFICGGLALWLEVSYLLAAIAMGAVVVNLARHHDRPFHSIEEVEWPFLVVFFMLAGASLQLDELRTMGVVGAVYMGCRILGKIVGAWLGACVTTTDIATRRWMGLAMLPQAGAAMGMALLAATHLPDYRQLLLGVIIGSSVLFELIGPVLTRIALKRAAAISPRH